MKSVRGFGPRALPPILVIGIMILASIGPLAQLARAQGGASAAVNATVTSEGYGIVVALNMSVSNVAALFKAWGVPSNSSLWAKLQEINNTIPRIEELVKQGKLDEARSEAAKLFQELGLLVAEAAKLYARHLEQANATVQRLVAETNRLAAIERALMASLTATLRHLERALQWAQMSGAVCDNVTAKLEEMINETEKAIATDKQLLNETLALRQSLLAGSISAEKAVNETEQLKTMVEAFVKQASSLMEQARIAIAEPHACKAMESLHKLVEKLREKIMNMTEEAKKLRQEGKTRAAQILEKEAEELERMLQRYEQLMNNTKTEIMRPHGLGDIIKIIKIRDMMPRIIVPIFKKIHILPIQIMPIKSIDREIIELKMVTLELRAMSNLVPSNLSAQYKQALGNLSELVNILEEYRAGKATKDEVAKAANQTLAALESFRQALKQYKQEILGSKQSGSSTTTATSSAGQTNTSATNTTKTHTSTRTSTHTRTHTHNSSTTTPRHTETTTARTKGGHSKGSSIGVLDRETSNETSSKASSTSTTSHRESGSSHDGMRGSIETRKIDILLHIVDKAEEIVKHIIVSLGYAPETISEKEAMHMARSVAVAERIIDAAARLAKLTGNETLVEKISSVGNVLEEAKKSLEAGNTTLAKKYLEQALNETKQLLSSIEAKDWVTLKTRMFIERVEMIIQTMLAMISMYTS